MAKNNPLQHTINRRTLIIGSGQILLGSLLVGRMAYLQIWQAEHYETLAQGNSIKIKPILPDRGIITDRSGTILAQNQKHFRAILDHYEADDIITTLNNFSNIVNIPPSILSNLQNQHKINQSQFTIIKENLTWEEIASLESHIPDIPGVRVEEGSARFYPKTIESAHLIGYVQIPSVNDQKINNSISHIAGITVGKSGLEKTQNQILQGKPGYREVEVNARRQTIRTLKTTKSSHGNALALTIDAKLQNFVHRRLSQERSASAVVMNIHNGDVLALNSYPSFDPNLFSGGISQDDWRLLLQNPYKPLINKAIGGEYPPGSVFKLVVAIAALERGIVSPEQTFHCPGFLEVSNHRFHCVRSYGHGHLRLAHAIAQSCDVYFYKLALKVGIENIAKTANLLGLGTQTGIELTNEKSGLVPTKQWKRRRFGQPWMIGETVIAGIGQGYVQATPLQMALMMARITNGGHAIAPQLIAATAPPSYKKNITSQALRPILEGTNLAINNQMGTGYRMRIIQPDFAMGGKTSTSQVRGIDLADRKSGKHRKEQPWNMRDHSIFVGYAPVHKPEYVTAVVVEHGGWGSKTAAPIARDILLKTQQIFHKD